MKTGYEVGEQVHHIKKGQEFKVAIANTKVGGLVITDLSTKTHIEVMPSEIRKVYLIEAGDKVMKTSYLINEEFLVIGVSNGGRLKVVAAKRAKASHYIQRAYVKKIESIWSK